jgi:hypothetical protein
MAAYGLGGWLSWGTLRASLVLAAAILAGNLLGQRVRRRLTERATSILCHATLAVCLLLALLGMVH